MFQDFCKDTVLVAHNATFDVGFMNANYKRHGMPTITQPVIDTLELARNLYPEYKRHGLGPLTNVSKCLLNTTTWPTTMPKLLVACSLFS
jgi:DNA polymerase III, alpha subunit (gram-positive type)